MSKGNNNTEPEESADPILDAGEEEERLGRRRRARLIVIAILIVCALIVIATTLAVILPNRNDDDTAKTIAFTGNPENQASLLLTLSTVSSVMNQQQKDTFVQVVANYLAPRREGWENLLVGLENEKLVPSSRVASEFDSQLRIRVETVRARLDSRDLAQEITNDTAVFISMLRHDSKEDTYFDSVTEITVPLSQFETSAPTSTPVETPVEAPVNTPVAAPVGETGSPETPVAETLAPVLSPPVSVSQACNGLPNLCDMAVNEILFATAHNANAHAAVMNFAPNHDQNVSTALEAGFRGLSMDVGYCDDELSLVHADCLLGFSSPMETFTEIVQFLVDNPNEVLIMPIEINDNTGGKVDLNELFVVMEDSNVGNISFADLMYMHPNTATAWPTLQELIDANKRILFFIYNSDSCAVVGCPPGFHDWFAYAAETQFSFESIDSLVDDVERACTITRGGSGTRDFFGINIFLSIPSRTAAEQFNDFVFLESHVETCSNQTGLKPNLILVDFGAIGDVLEYVQDYNLALASTTSTEAPTVAPIAMPMAMPIAMPVPVAVNDTGVTEGSAPSAGPTTSPMPSTEDEKVCNGMNNLCNVRINNMLFATAHNAHATPQTVPASPNQDLSVTRALEAGVRAIHVGMGLCRIEGTMTLSLVHGSCLNGYVDPVSFFTEINSFLARNPTEVVVLLGEVDDNIGGEVTIDAIEEAMVSTFDMSANKGLADRLYDHPIEDRVVSPWPLLKDLVEMDKRLLFFFYGGRDRKCIRGRCPDGFHEFYDFVAVTDNEVVSVEGIAGNIRRSCRVADGRDETEDFYALNHFVVPGNASASAQLNSRSMLESRISTCTEETENDVNFVLVDFWNSGDLLQVAGEYNSMLIEETPAPSSMPSISAMPSLAPSTSEPTQSPTPEPTEEPTAEPTEETPEPTEQETPEPTGQETEEPTEQETDEPTDGPAPAPTSAPVSSPTAAPIGTAATSPPVPFVVGPNSTESNSTTVPATLSPTATPTFSPSLISPATDPTGEPTLIVVPPNVTEREGDNETESDIETGEGKGKGKGGGRGYRKRRYL